MTARTAHLAAVALALGLPPLVFIISGLIRRSYKVRNPDGSVSAKKFGYRIVRALEQPFRQLSGT